MGSHARRETRLLKATVHPPLYKGTRVYMRRHSCFHLASAISSLLARAPALHSRSRFDDSDSRLHRRHPKAGEVTRGTRTHTHTTTLSDECVAPGPSGSAPPCPSPVSSGWLRRHSPYQNPPHTPPHHFSFPESACASGAGVATPTVCTPEWSGKCGRHGACVARSCGQKKCTCSPLTPPQCACP